jgi:hypothetical protein
LGIFAPSTASRCRAGSRSRPCGSHRARARDPAAAYALRACYAALQQISTALEEAAENLGATKARTVRRIVLPMMTGGILAGFISSFSTAAVELSATLMLVQSSSDAPWPTASTSSCSRPRDAGRARRSASSRSVLVALCALLSHLVIERGHAARAPALNGIRPMNQPPPPHDLAASAAASAVEGVNLSYGTTTS